MLILKLVWLIYFIQLFLYMLISPLISNHEVGLLILILIHSMFVFIFMFKFNKKNRLIFYGAFVVRFIVMMVDIYMRAYIAIPHSGSDTEGFLNRAISISGSLHSIVSSTYEFFIKMVAIIFRITANERIIIQYTNVLLGLTIVYLLYLILEYLKVSKTNKKNGIIFASFFPHSLFFSGILLREIASTFFIVASVYFLVKWYINLENKNFWLSILMVLISSLFHSGVIGFLLAHIFLYLFYDQNNKQIIYSSKTLFYFVGLSLFFMWFFGVYDWNNLAVFRKVSINGIEDVVEASSSRHGASAYLTSLSTNNMGELILYTPLLILFFISSPLPMNWRGISDIFSFLFDGIIYLGISIFIIKNYKSNVGKYKALVIILLVGLIGVLIIFGIGVQNAGTALRHRHKVFNIFLLIYILIKDEKYRESYTN